MTTELCQVALMLIRENFGEVAQAVASLLIKKRSCSFHKMSELLNLDTKLLAKVVVNMLIHELLEYELSARKMVEYKFNPFKALKLLRVTKHMRIARELFASTGEAVIEELSVHGQLELSSIVLKLLWRLKQEKQLGNDLKAVDAHIAAINQSFGKMVDEGFVEKCPLLKEQLVLSDVNRMETDAVKTETPAAAAKKSKVPNLVEPSGMEMFSIPEIKISDEIKLKLLQNDADVLAINSRGIAENLGDGGVFWRVKETKFSQIARDQAIIEAVSNKMDENAANLIRIVLKFVDTSVTATKAQRSNLVSKPMTSIDIQKEMRNEYQMDSTMVEKYLSLIVQDSFRVLEKIGDFSGGAYSVDFKRASSLLCHAHIESYVRERFGSRGLRIFNVVMEKVQVEEKQIVDFSLIPSKDCKAKIYEMVNDGVLTITELSKTSDHAPSRTFYLFRVDTYEIAKKLINNSLKALFNLMLKREHLSAENKRLLEKSAKIDAMIEALVAQSADQADIDDVKSMMNHEELNSLNKITDRCNKIENAEIQLEETIFILENYLYYNTVEPVIQTGRRAATS